MKFSFEAQNYRDNLSNELREKRKESKENAKKIIDERRETDEYILAKDIKNVLAKNEINKGTSEQGELRVIERRDIDSEHEIITIDISDKIPKNIKIYFDKLRLNKIQSEVDNYPVRGFYGNVSSGLGSKEIEKRDEILSKVEHLTMCGIGEKMCQIDDKQDRAAKSDAENLIDELTEGAFYNPKMLCHVVDGMSSESAIALRRRYPHLDNETGTLKENNFKTNDIIGQGPYNDIWFSAGGADMWLRPEKVVVLSNSEGERLQKLISGISTYSGTRPEWRGMPLEELLKQATRFASIAPVDGINISFNKKISWEQLADWIIDLYHGKIYKIQKKGELNDAKNSKESYKPEQNFALEGIDREGLDELEESLRQEACMISKEDLDFMRLKGLEFEGENIDEKYKAKIESENAIKKQKYAEIFNLQIDQVALSKIELNEKTVVVIGDLSMGNSFSDMINLKYIIGNLTIWNKEDLELPVTLKYISGNLDVRSSQIRLPDNVSDIVKGRIRRSYPDEL